MEKNPKTFTLCGDGGKERMWHPFGDDAVSKLREAKRDKTPEVRTLQKSRGDLA